MKDIHNFNLSGNNMIREVIFTIIDKMPDNLNEEFKLFIR